MQDLIFHKASTRGNANHGWLDSHHTFSFGSYHNPERMHFGALRVLNDDIVKGGMGFSKHPHDNMEIISIPLRGALKHNDTTGRNEIIKTGDVQIMSAGTGISHSEVNASKTEDVNFLQLWIIPKKRNIAPRYEQKTFDVSGCENKFQTVVSPNENGDSLWINQDAWLSFGNIKKDFTAYYNINNKTNGIYVFMIEGDVMINSQMLGRRDGIGVKDLAKLEIKADSDAELLVIEVPVQI